MQILFLHVQASWPPGRSFRRFQVHTSRHPVMPPSLHSILVSEWSTCWISASQKFSKHYLLVFYALVFSVLLVLRSSHPSYRHVRIPRVPIPLCPLASVSHVSCPPLVSSRPHVLTSSCSELLIEVSLSRSLGCRGNSVLLGSARSHELLASLPVLAALPG